MDAEMEQSIEEKAPPPVEQPELPVVLDWDSPDDPRNPHNWSRGKRVYHTICTAVYAFSITYMSSAYAPGASQTAAEFGVSESVSLLGVSLFCLGLALGPMLGAPLSETFGRLIIYRVGFPLSMLFLIGSAVSNNIAGVVLCRFFSGMFGSPALSVGGGTVADIWPPSERGPATYLFVMAPFLGPSLSPVIGGFVVETKGWRWLEWVSVFLGVLTILSTLGMRETYKKIILRRQVGKGPPVALKSAGSYLHSLQTWVRESMLRPLTILFSEPIVLFLSLYVGFDFAVLYAFFPALPLVFSEVYGFSPYQVGLVFLSLGIGALLATLTSVLCDKYIYQRKLRRRLASGNSGHLPPESRLYPAIMGSLGVALGLFWFAWTARPSIHWISPVISLIPFQWGNLCIFSSTIVYVMDCYGPRYGASALSGNAFTRYVFAAGFPLFTIQMYNRLTVQWAASLLGLVAILLIPVPWVLFFWGPKIRSWSRLAYLKA